MSKKVVMLPASVVERMTEPVIINQKNKAAKDATSALMGFSRAVKFLLGEKAGQEMLTSALAYQRRVLGKEMDLRAVGALMALASHGTTEGFAIAFIRQFASDTQKEKIGETGGAIPIKSVITLIEKAVSSGTAKNPTPPIEERLAAFVNADKLPTVDAVLQAVVLVEE